MNEEKQQHEDYLADVFRVWNCDEERWMGSTPIVLRFENEDVLVRASTQDPDDLHFVKVASHAPISGAMCARTDEAGSSTCRRTDDESSDTNEETIDRWHYEQTDEQDCLDCLCWRRDKAFSSLVGLKLGLAATRTHITALLRLEAAEMRFLRLLGEP